MQRAVVIFHFRLSTDHSSLQWLSRNFKEPEGQLVRWLEQLEEYDFNIVHRQGKLYTNVDALSRLPHMNMEGNESSDCAVSAVATTSILPLLCSQNIRSEQLQDNLVGPFLQAKEN